MEIVVEIIDPSMRNARIEKLDATELHIGRAWNSDVLITDPDVDAEHLHIQLLNDTDTFTLTDLESINGSRHEKKKFEGQIEAGFGELIQLGHTQLRIHRLHDPVPATKLRSPLENQLVQLHRPTVALSLGITAILIQLLGVYLSSPRDLEWHSVLTTLISMTTSIVLFSVLLAGLGKLFRHEFIFWPNLGLAASAIILYKILGIIASWISFNILSEGLDDFISILITASILALWLIPSLHLCTPLSPGIRNTITAVVVGITVATSYILPSFRDTFWQHGRPDLVTESLPPAMLLTPRVSQEEYQQRMVDTFSKADEMAVEAREEQAEQGL